jgi:hypothetical protein
MFTYRNNVQYKIIIRIYKFLSNSFPRTSRRTVKKANQFRKHLSENYYLYCVSLYSFIYFQLNILLYNVSEFVVFISKPWDTLRRIRATVSFISLIIKQQYKSLFYTQLGFRNIVLEYRKWAVCKTTYYIWRKTPFAYTIYSILRVTLGLTMQFTWEECRVKYFYVGKYMLFSCNPPKVIACC